MVSGDRAEGQRRATSAFDRGSRQVDHDLERVHDVIRQLNLVGELEVPASQQLDSCRSVSTGRACPTKMPSTFSALVAAFGHFDSSRWATFRIFHTFSGSQYAPAVITQRPVHHDHLGRRDGTPWATHYRDGAGRIHVVPAETEAAAGVRHVLAAPDLSGWDILC